MPNDCRDFWDALESTPIKTVQKKTHTARNWSLATASVLTVAACTLIIVLNFNIIKNFFFASPELPDTPIIITADEKDEFDGSDSSEEPSGLSDHISPLLKEAMKTAPENALFRTMVSDPSFYEYLNNYERDGYKYIDFRKGTLKDQFEPDAYYTKMNELEYNARMDFFEYVAQKYNITDAERPVDSSDYSMEEYHFIANLSRDQINMLAEVNCVLRLARPKREVDNKDVITDGLHSQIDDTPKEPDNVVNKTDVDEKPQENVNEESPITEKLSNEHNDTTKIEVRIYLKIDSASSPPYFNPDYYADTIVILKQEQLNEKYISDYTDAFIKENNLNVIEKNCSLWIDPYQTIQNGICIFC